MSYPFRIIHMVLYLFPIDIPKYYVWSAERMYLLLTRPCVNLLNLHSYYLPSRIWYSGYLLSKIWYSGYLLSYFHYLLSECKLIEECAHIVLWLFARIQLGHRS